jgi:hypothetical protein
MYGQSFAFKNKMISATRREGFVWCEDGPGEVGV